MPVLCDVLVLAVLMLQAAPAPQERARVEYVLVDVVARDRGNRLVTDLTIDDFVVTDAGRRISLESLDILDLRRDVVESGTAPVAGDAAFLPVPREARRSQVILALDILGEGPGPPRQAVRGVDRYLERTSLLRGLEYRLHSIRRGTLMEDFSEDPAVVRRVLDAFGSSLDEMYRGLVDVGTPEDLFGLEKRFCDCYLAAVGGSLWNCVQSELHPFIATRIAQTDSLLRELADLPSKFTDPDAVKTIVLVSNGFSLRPGPAVFSLAEVYSPPTSRPPPPRPFGSPGAPQDLARESLAEPPMPWPELMSFQDEYLRILDVFARERITFHGVDLFLFGIEEQRAFDMQLPSQCPRASSPYRAYRLEQERGPEDLGRQTGGTFARDLWPLRPQLEGDRFVYVLGYRRPPGEPGQFRKIKVRCKRRFVNLTHRGGYVS